MSEKKGLMYYLENPAEAAKKLFPFIDIDTMMQANKERYEALGVDPEMGKNIMGFALNPVGHLTGATTGAILSKASQGLLSAINKRKAIKQLSKDILSPEGIQRYINNATANAKHSLKSLENRKQIFSVTHSMQRGKNKEIWSNQLRKVNEEINAVKGNIEYLKTPEFIDEYVNIVQHKMKNTPVSIKKLEPGVAGKYNTYHGLEEKLKGVDTDLLRNYDTSTYPGFMGVPKMFRGAIELSPRSALSPSSTTPLHEMKHAVQEALRGYIHSAKKSIPLTEKGTPIALARAKIKDAISGLNPTDKNSAVRRAKYLLKPQEISARLSQIRINPSKTSGAYKDLKRIFRTDKNIQWAKDNIWAAAPIGLMDYATKNKK